MICGAFAVRNRRTRKIGRQGTLELYGSVRAFGLGTKAPTFSAPGRPRKALCQSEHRGL